MNAIQGAAVTKAHPAHVDAVRRITAVSDSWDEDLFEYFHSWGLSEVEAEALVADVMRILS